MDTKRQGIATRSACTARAVIWHTSIILKFASSAYLSAACWKKIVTVLANTVSTCPATATGSAMAIPADTDWLPTMTRMVEMTLARAESGDCAAPIFIHPSAIISRVPPSMIPVFTSPRMIPTKVHAINGLCVWNESSTLPIPTIHDTINSNTI